MGNANAANRRADLVTRVLTKHKGLVSALRPLADKAKALEKANAELKQNLEKAELKNKQEAEKTRQEQVEHKKTKDLGRPARKGPRVNARWQWMAVTVGGGARVLHARERQEEGHVCFSASG